MEVDELIAAILRLPRDDLDRVLAALRAAEAGSATDIAPGQERRLVRNEYGYLVVEALPGEPQITTEEVKKILNEMEW